MLCLVGSSTGGWGELRLSGIVACIAQRGNDLFVYCATFVRFDFLSIREVGQEALFTILYDSPGTVPSF